MANPYHAADGKFTSSPGGDSKAASQFKRFGSSRRKTSSLKNLIHRSKGQRVRALERSDKLIKAIKKNPAWGGKGIRGAHPSKVQRATALGRVFNVQTSLKHGVTKNTAVRFFKSRGTVKMKRGRTQFKR